MKLTYDRHKNCTHEFQIRLINKNVYLNYCASNYISVPGIPYKEFMTNIRYYLNEFFKPFKVSEKYEGHCFRTNGPMCNWYIDVRNKVAKVQICLSVMTRCKAGCEHCVRFPEHNSGISIEEETQITCDIIDILNEYDFIDNINFTTMGDASLYDLPRILQHLKPNGYQIRILTNGYDIEMLRKGQKFALDNNYTNIDCVIALPTLTKEIHKKIYKIDNFDRVKQWLDEGQEGKGYHIICHYIMYEDSKNEYIDLINYVKKFGYTLWIIPDFHGGSELHNYMLNLVKSGKIIEDELIKPTIRS